MTTLIVRVDSTDDDIDFERFSENTKMLTTMIVGGYYIDYD
jgi:hypothetical protein